MILSNIVCRKLTQSFEKESAALIVNKKYSEQGYGPQGLDKEIGTYLTAESSLVFWAFVDNVMYGTVSIVFNDNSSLPMDQLYKEEVDILRKENYKVAEVVQFAVDQDISKKYLSFAEASLSAAPLFGIVLAYAKEKGVDYLCISVNPKHVNFYSQIGFHIIGDEKYYTSVNAPAVAMCLSIKDTFSHNFVNSTIGRIIHEFAIK